MNRSSALSLHAAALYATTALALALPSPQASAHGSFTVPESRIYKCYLGNRENPTDPACRAAWAVAGSQLFYDWNGINQANANGNHRAVVPDGELCSGGNPTFRGLDVIRSDWQTSDVPAGSHYTFTFHATAPHATRDWVFYVTPEGWNPSTPLRWNDMQEFCRAGSTPLSAGNNYHISCTLPARSGRHVIYNTWQRSDSTEAFYSCMDVQFRPSVLAAGSTWAEAGRLNVVNDYPVGTAVTLRVFNADGSDAESIRTVLAEGETSVIDWPRRVGEEVNARARFARVGERIADTDEVQVKRAGIGQQVWVTGRRSFAVDVELPESDTPYADEHVH